MERHLKMSRLRREFMSLEPSYDSCHRLYQRTLRMISKNKDVFDCIILTMLKTQLKDQSNDTIKETLIKRIHDLNPTEDLLPPDHPSSSDESGSVVNDRDSLSTTDSGVSSIGSTFEELGISDSDNPGPSDIKSRELKVLLAGDVNAGKTSVLNILMGGEYLPAYCNKCTMIPCEIHNSDLQLARVCYTSGKPDMVELPLNKSDNAWKSIRNIIISGEHNEKVVQKLEIFWPMLLLQDIDTDETIPKQIDGEDSLDSSLTNADIENLHKRFRTDSGIGSYIKKRSNETALMKRVTSGQDAEETYEKQVVGDEDSASTSASIPRPQKALPIVFLDLPGLWYDESEKGIPRLMENIPDFHLFIFVIDICVPIGETMNQLMREIDTKMARYGNEFNPEAVLFLLNRADNFHENPRRSRVEETVLQTIQKQWPVVNAYQIQRISCLQMQNRNEGIGVFREKIWDFLANVNRLNIEEHCLWLTRLLEVVVALFKTGLNWTPYNQCLTEVKKLANEDDKYLVNEITAWEDRKSIFCKEILAVVRESEDKLESHLLQGIQNQPGSVEIMVHSLVNGQSVKDIKRHFQSKVTQILKDYKAHLSKNLKLGEYMKQARESTANMDKILMTLGTLVTVPIAPIAMLGMSLAEEIEIFITDPTKRTIYQRKRWFLQEANTCIKTECDFLAVQRNIRLEILSIHPLKSTTRQHDLAEEIEKILNELWVIYVGNVIKHNYAREEVEVNAEILHANDNCIVSVVNVQRDSFNKKCAKKLVRSFLDRTCDRHTTLQSFPHDMDIYRELIIMRALSRKAHENFVLFYGSSSWVQGHDHVLAIIMELCDMSLKDVILSLSSSDRNRRHWKANGGRKRLQYAVDAAKGLAFVHQNGFVHRDVKPHNFLVKKGVDGRRDVVKICDVGHTKETDRIQTEAKGNRGTPAYYAPEIYNDGATQTIESDVYSFGLVLWEMWHCQKISTKPGKPPPLSKTVKGTVGDIIKQCLVLSPQERPSCHEIVLVLEQELPRLQ